MPTGILAYNPAAGRFPSRLLAERAANVLRAGGWEISLKRSTNGDHITRLAHQAAEDHLDALFMAGGDGSINCAVAGLAGSQTALGVLPAGTSNVFAQELGLPALTWARWLALEESARLLVNAPIRQVDLGICDGQFFLLWAGVGLDAFIVHRIEPRRRWEKHFAVVHYGTSVVWHAGFWHGMNLKVEVDNQQVEGHFLLGLVSNINLYAGGILHLSPQARMDDGLMDLWLFEGETLGDTVQLALDLFSGRHDRSPKVFHALFRELRLETESTLYLQVDGEPVIGKSPASVKVLPKSLRVLVPEGASSSLFGPAQE
jgi:YegS/Rv2252/BmrU family lipid kinase